MGNSTITMYGMKNCPLCDKAKKLLKHWDYEYYVLDVEPYQKRDYPFFVIGNRIYGYKDIVSMIASDDLRILVFKSNGYGCDKVISRIATCGRKPYMEVYPDNGTWSYLCFWHYIIDRIKCFIFREKHGYCDAEDCDDDELDE